jgi:hypothetical protein
MDQSFDKLGAAEARIAALEADRDYWRRQHDLVMADWKADCDTYEARLAEGMPRAATPSPPSSAIHALRDLLRFYDPHVGAVRGQLDGEFLFDVFARAARMVS